MSFYTDFDPATKASELTLKRLELEAQIQRHTYNASILGRSTSVTSPPKEPAVHEDWTKDYREVTSTTELAALLKLGVPCMIYRLDLGIYKPMQRVNIAIHRDILSSFSPFLLDKFLANYMKDITILVEVE